jgi:hypothetical protein
MAELQIVFWFCGIYSAVVVSSLWLFMGDGVFPAGKVRGR